MLPRGNAPRPTSLVLPSQLPDASCRLSTRTCVCPAHTGQGEHGLLLQRAALRAVPAVHQQAPGADRGGREEVRKAQLGVDPEEQGVWVLAGDLGRAGQAQRGRGGGSWYVGAAAKPSLEGVRPSTDCTPWPCRRGPAARGAGPPPAARACNATACSHRRTPGGRRRSQAAAAAAPPPAAASPAARWPGQCRCRAGSAAGERAVREH